MVVLASKALGVDCADMEETRGSESVLAFEPAGNDVAAGKKHPLRVLQQLQVRAKGVVMLNTLVARRFDRPKTEIFSVATRLRFFWRILLE